MKKLVRRPDTTVKARPRGLLARLAPLALALSAGLTGCYDEDPSPSGAGDCQSDECYEYGPGITDDALDDLVAACNYHDTFTANVALGNTQDPFRITPACELALLDALTLGTNLASDDELRSHVLDALHVLFFHPLFHPADGTLYGDQLAVPELLTELAEPSPAGADFELTPAYANRALIRYYFDHISLLGYTLTPGLGEAAEYDAGKILVSPFFYSLLEDQAWDLGAINDESRYRLASILFHELAHVRFPYHMLTQGPEFAHASGDGAADVWMNRAYGSGGSLQHLMGMSALISRPQGSPVHVLDEPSALDMMELVCRDLLSRVRELDDLRQASPDPGGFCAASVDSAVDELLSPGGGVPVGGGTTPMPFAGLIVDGGNGTFTVDGILVAEQLLRAGQITQEATGTWVTWTGADGSSQVAYELTAIARKSVLRSLGLHVNDRILAAGGVPAADLVGLARLLDAAGGLTSLDVQIERAGQPLVLHYDVTTTP